MTTTSLTLSSVTTLPASRTQVGGIGVLQSQLTRYEKQLADWCACPSGKTAEGKRVIAGLETQAAAVRSRIKQIDDAQGRAAVSPPVPARSAQPLSTDALSLTGNLIDVYA
jgi:hypothetical protein